MRLRRHKDGTVTRRRVSPARILAYGAVLLGGFALTCLSIHFYQTKIKKRDTVASLYAMWDKISSGQDAEGLGKEALYRNVYESSCAILDRSFMNNAALTFKGFSAFYIAVSSNVPEEAQKFIDESINALRLAVISPSAASLPQVQYMLGKAYFYKNSFSSYYHYADLVVRYLSRARAAGYKADDMNEYLGLSYASLGMTEQSIASLTEALVTRESDTLLMRIAEQYYKNKQNSAAKQYLYRVQEKTASDEILIRSRLLLGEIALEEKDADSAWNEFSAVLEKEPNSADANFGLGLVYELRGDIAKARAEWRKVLRLISPNHPGATKKLSEYK